MFDSSQIKGLGLVGWRASTVDGVPALTAANSTTSSGMTYNDYSNLVTVQNAWLVQEDSGISDAEFNTFLTDFTNAAFNKVLNAIFQDNDYIENRVLFPYENVWTETIENTTSFVGYEINPANRRDLVITINNVFTSFDSVDSVKLLLFHSSQSAPIDTKTIATEEKSDTDTLLNWMLSNFKYSGGKYYVGYLRSGLTAKAINRDWDSANVQSCFNMFRIQPIIVDGWDSETLFDVDDIEYEDETYGLNFDITSWKDYTNVILRNKNKFITALGYQVANDLLDLIVKSTRSNRIERITQEFAMMELNGVIIENQVQSIGIVAKLGKEIKRLKEIFIDEPEISRGTL